VREMQHGNRKIICEKLTPPFIENGTLSKSRDEIFIRGRAITPLVLSCLIALALHEHKHH
jgi:hypothetical protein